MLLVGEPALDRLVEGLVPRGGEMDAAVGEVPVDGGVDVAGAEVFESGALAIALARSAAGAAESGDFSTVFLIAANWASYSS